MSESTQHELDTVRAPRVQITYDLQKGDAIELKELPYMIGVISDLSGHPDPNVERKRLKQRSMVEINRDNFDKVLEGMAPRLQLEVDNTLKGDNSKIGVTLTFNSMQDFEPAQLVKQIEPLRKLFEARQRLKDLRNKMAGNERLEEEIQKILSSTELLQKIQAETNAGGPTQ